MRRLLLLATALTLLTLQAGRGPEGSERDTIRAAHPAHHENGLACEVCHGSAGASRSGADNLLPSKGTCADCHDVEDAADCGRCHTKPDSPTAAARVAETARLFSHESHLSRGMECEECHGDPAGDPRLPEKPLCRTCHSTAAGFADCEVCHATSEALLPLTHSKGWLWFHGADARTAGESCAGCHTEAGCQDCHAGDNVRPRSHGLDFVFGHALEARGRETDCVSCHDEASFCVSCHVAERVYPENHSRADWVLSDGGRHSEEALFEMESCVACHGDAGGSPICADCHGR
ncbi:MAG: cytochrome c3 family protein [Candidatus Eisenbacteria bacterium]